MKVVATKVGMDGVYLRKAGDVFEIKDDLNQAGEVIAFSKKWMRRLETQDSMLTVIAIAGRFDGPIWRYPGERFTIPNEQGFSGDWMRWADKHPQKEKQD